MSSKTLSMNLVVIYKYFEMKQKRLIEPQLTHFLLIWIVQTYLPVRIYIRTQLRHNPEYRVGTGCTLF